jgi:hypothetical protein
MSQWYRERPSPKGRTPVQPCARHRRGWFGVFKERKLYAYALVSVTGETMVFSTILGHGDHMEDGIMWLLVFEAVKWNHEQSRTEYALYFLHDSGSAGLQFFKRKMGFAGFVVRWELSRPAAVDS